MSNEVIEMGDDSRSFRFWRRWWLLGAAYGVLSGVGLVVSALMADETSRALALRIVFALDPRGPGPITSGTRLTFAISGALTAGLSVTAWFLCPTAVPEPAADRRGARAVAAGLATWCVMDCASSIWLGGAVNVIPNMTFVIGLLPPCIAIDRK